DFVARVNSDLVGKYVNIASRCAGFIAKRFSGKLAAPDISTEIEHDFAFASQEIAGYYQHREYGKALRKIMQLADSANQYVDANKPWDLAKAPDKAGELHKVCSTALALFRDLTLYMKPVLPELADRASRLLNIEALSWADAWRHLPAGHEIRPYQHLMTRIERKQIDALIGANRQSLQAPAPQTHSPTRHAEHQLHTEEKVEIAPIINIDDFGRVDLRIAKIVNAEHVAGADKLLKLTLDLGGTTRTVFAGIKSAYDPEQLKGRLTVVVANLAPRKMKFGVSEGMVLAASGDGPGIFLLSPDSGAQPGMRVK
ncbi:MAG TPA: methionine--tRNA ligase subunit beta, partial [Burkholderiales bacterium]|nr:methionine--tRNA ligase subunit beta [Burkholderiales bacterium]